MKTLVPFRVFLLIALLVGFGSACASLGFAERWPEVQEIHEEYRFSNIEQAGFDLTLNSVAGTPLYTLNCHSGDFEDDSGFNYSGLLACRLFSLYSKETVSTLLTETLHQAMDWRNRGRFMQWHLLPGCAEYPDWGRSRTFRLRGMELIISITDAHFARTAAGAEVLQSYAVEVTLKRDQNAQTAVAQAAQLPEPPWFYSSSHQCSR